MQASSTVNSTARGIAADTTRSATVMAALAAGFLGLFLIWGVGFSHIEVIHNAAHDVRHSNGFPCH